MNKLISVSKAGYEKLKAENNELKAENKKLAEEREESQEYASDLNEAIMEIKGVIKRVRAERQEALRKNLETTDALYNIYKSNVENWTPANKDKSAREAERVLKERGRL